MYQAAAIDADGDIWGQRMDGTWVCVQYLDSIGSEPDLASIARRFGPLATCSLIKVEE